ncbi:Riboflavin biosynthesis protein RibF [termite gut metagenome]|uniref:Bifunctional riboflavin kinase/FMN adenylyltransferase n=1 Tax=termite gut metagenome TaxID=433724 RepID=A0A5J4T0W1_9ZZZZ
MRIIRKPLSFSLPEPCVATIGFFDGIHKGHRFLINQLKEIAASKGIRSAIITFPVHPRTVMNVDYQSELLTTCDEKIEMLTGTGIDYCIMFDFTKEVSRLSAREFMADVLRKRYNVQTLVIGYDHRFGHNRSESFDDYLRYGKELGMEVLPARAYTCDNVSISSSVVRSFLHKGEVDNVVDYLGYNYFLTGTVVDGYQVGRAIGFPTANIRVDDPDKLIPFDGVYAVRVTVNGESFTGMLNIGHRPTVRNDEHRSIEVHLLHFRKYIYNQSIRVFFIKRLRSEEKFDSVEALTAQLHKDASAVEALFKASASHPST